MPSSEFLIASSAIETAVGYFIKASYNAITPPATPPIIVPTIPNCEPIKAPLKALPITPPSALKVFPKVIPSLFISSIALFTNLSDKYKPPAPINDTLSLSRIVSSLAQPFILCVIPFDKETSAKLISFNVLYKLFNGESNPLTPINFSNLEPILYNAVAPDTSPSPTRSLP